MYEHKWSNWNDLGEITVKDRNGRVSVYSSLEQAVHSVFRYGDRVVVKYGHLAPRWEYTSPGLRGFVSYGNGDTHAFYTCEGILIPLWKVLSHTENVPVYRYRYRNPRFKFRDGPVEGISHGRAGRYRGYRRIGTHPQRREADFFDHYDEDAAEYGMKVRCKRNRAGLPTSWDDIRVHDYYKKSWKNYRKTQWFREKS